MRVEVKFFWNATSCSLIDINVSVEPAASIVSVGG
jgi:hypothetical protein